jgi:K(+)-stimulated pyrophosphate-energized sodium pump
LREDGVIVTVERLLFRVLLPAVVAGVLLGTARPVMAQAAAPAAQEVQRHEGGEASLILPDLSVVDFHGINGRTLLMGGLLVCGLGLLFGMLTFTGLRNLPVHGSMREVSELIY